MNKKHQLLAIIFLALASLLAFGRIAGNDFINFDDPGYITENPIVQSGLTVDSIKRAFTTVVVENWVTLAILSHTLDWSLFGNNPAGHHLMSLFFHIGAVLFLFLFLYKTTNHLWASAFAAAFFALHPLRVESVAWASERKDVLSMFFGMASLYVYAFYAKESRGFSYVICLILFTLGLLSKSILVTLPFVLLLVDSWPLNRWNKGLVIGNNTFFVPEGRLLVEKIPFFLLTGVVSVITFVVQHDQGVVYPPLGERIAGSLVAYVVYLKKTLWPFDLALFYFSQEVFPLGQVALSVCLLLLITAVVLSSLKRMPFLFTGWFWYLGTLVPMIGLIPTSAWVADHYTYLPSIGIAIMLAWGVPALLERAGLGDVRRKVLWPLGIGVLILLVLLSFRQAGFWKDSISLWRYTVTVTEGNAHAHTLLGGVLAETGKINEAIGHHNIALTIMPDYALAFNNRGVAYASIGMHQNAFDDFNNAIHLKQNYANAYRNRGLLYGTLEDYFSAIKDHNKAIEFDPGCVDCFYNRSFYYFKLGDTAAMCKDAVALCELKDCELLERLRHDQYCK